MLYQLKNQQTHTGGKLGDDGIKRQIKKYKIIAFGDVNQKE